MTSDALHAPQPGAPLDDEPPERRPGRARRRGPRRRPGDGGGSRPSSTQEAILTAARESFLTQGYEGTTIRAVARTAGVDPALVSYYFGSKGDLFGAAVNLRARASQEIATAIGGDLLSAGPRLVRLSLTAWDDDAGGATFRTLLQWMAADIHSPEAIQNYATEQIATPMAEALEQSGLSSTLARERAALVGSQLVGLAMIRYVLRLEPIAGASIDHLVEVVGPTIQHYLTGPLQPA
ncbi:TetR/AcrR family transcriptional regulator [Actinomyces oris]|uniref:TetR family transcriptional regulator n=1 Tax=Actinomyces oris TaxID=544580 RepID=A0A1Q8VDR7_9ACTO|nr:TetR family transcriptional regulator [Actinomyces oris]OLL14428.1 TetR family transcriptional regulator [Actinomyces oris]OLO46224.1 TetR family transcriptional regulator [Actinomyces oris]